MSFQLDQVVPLGRSFDEYVAMFALTEDDLKKKILGCGDGPASFNAELTRRGGSVVSMDPLYAHGGDEIEQRIGETFEGVMEEVRKNRRNFVWKNLRSVDDLAAVRLQAMRSFLTDYAAGRADGRYQEGSLPALDLPAGSFELGLCSHFLFLYSQHFDQDFHIAAIQEMCRVSTEVRIFPLLQLGGKKSPYVEPVCEHFEGCGFVARTVSVPYEFQRGGDQMLRVVRAKAGSDRAAGS